ncbi:MAG TPA: Na+/H+ antiporter NhaA [Terriglobales bacterium]|nr:Na+/H+ antiporter NhaA [Terriglobales bacterium]
MRNQVSTDTGVSRNVLPIEVITSPFVRFARMEAAGGILLLASTFAALVWANSRWEYAYHAIWTTQVDIGFGRFFLSETRHEWINDGLMSAFFFLVGLEIKREVLIGELSRLKQAAFPLIAAIGGTIVPALIYVTFNRGEVTHKGWGIPMATDIAFALGVLALLGDRIPTSLKIFVTALAIVDDIIAVLVIALFYTEQIRFVSLATALVGIALSFGANLLGVRKPAIYAFLGICVWSAVLQSGVHATVAGVLFAFTIPARTYIDRAHFLKRGRGLLDRFEAAAPDSLQQHAAVHTLEAQCELVESPLHRIEHRLQPWVGFFVMPLFAFSNAGVHIFGNLGAAAKNSVSLGVALGLFLGKPIGISLFAWLATKARLAALPAAVSWGQIFGASWLCGIGFTMSLFIATLAFGEGRLLDLSKIGTLAGSVGAAICGSWFLLGKFGKLPRPANR